MDQYGGQPDPSGAAVDVLHGSLQLTTTVGNGTTKRDVFGGAIFKVTQVKRGALRPDHAVPGRLGVEGCARLRALLGLAKPRT